jgi:ankyrin repeat protein
MIEEKEQCKLDEELIDACSKGNTGIVKKLLENGANVNTVNEFDHQTNMRYVMVCHHSHQPCLRLRRF